MVDYVPLGARAGPGSSDPDLARFRNTVKHGILKTLLYICKRVNTGTKACESASLHKSMGPSKPF